MALKSERKTGDKAAADDEMAGITAEERAAMQELVRERRAAARRGNRATAADEENDVLEKIAAMPDTDRAIAERLHAIIKTTTPLLTPRLWYGMPAYVRDGKVVCFFQGAHKFKTRYATLGFSDVANLDDGAIWPVAFAVKELTSAVEEQIAALVRRAVS